jgi:hypothetical protein
MVAPVGNLMRVLVVHPGSDYSVADVHNGYVKAFRQLGCDVAEYNMHDRLAWFANARWNGEPLPSADIVAHAGLGLHGKLWEWWPDLIVVISGFYVHPWTWDILKGRPHQTAVVFTESPYEDDKQLELVQHAEPDVVIVNDPQNIGRFHAVHPKTMYLPHCYDPQIHHPFRPEPTHDFVFVGTAYRSRIEFFDAVKWDGLRVGLAGNWNDLEGTQLSPFLLRPPGECLPNVETADLYRSAKVSANLYRKESNRPDLTDGWAMGPREVELAATETFFLREPRGEGDDVFPMLPTFTEPDEFTELVRWWSAHDKQRKKVASAARKQILSRTFDVNARRLLQLVVD